MSRKSHCTACSNLKFGVKTRKSVPHTCGKDLKTLVGDAANYVNEGYLNKTITDAQVKDMSNKLGDIIEKTDKLINELKRNTGNSKA